MPLSRVDQRVIGRIAELVGRHQPRPETAGALEILAEAELPVVALIFAHRTFVIAGIAGDMIEGVLAFDVAAGLADDHRQLAFVIVSLGDVLARRPQRFLVSDLADRHAQENLRIDLRGGEPGLFDMELVVERQRPGGVRLADHRIEGDIVEREIRGFARRGGADLLQGRIDL